MALAFKAPHVIKATYRIVTPMFIGDAEQKASGISPASVKGALRFWWRALNWGQIRAEIQSDTAALQRLHREESALFGTSADNGKAARFTLRVNTNSLKFAHATDWPHSGNDPSGYLGIGLWESGNRARDNFQPHREYITENQTFGVELLCLPDVSAESQQQLRDALTAWGLLGGLGSRARRAFGAIAIESLDSTSLKFAAVTDYQAAVSKLFSSYRLATIKQAPFTSLCKETQFSISAKIASNARSAHAILGQTFKDYRGQPSDLRGSKKRVFGMPYAGGTALEGNARRASPLLFHVHPVGSQFVGATLFLPAEFHTDTALASVDYSLASQFLQKLPSAVLV
ncbi:type III-B CRISPR module RAMP protein Cmr1 [Thiothrix lacustris]|uniref:type III-B CRISPR module RAMP protein Cmr1 n=1 Tax=Thiothrix lacustris TaxID=525917 RepID=UPI000491C79F|nr:type III-B CRISPR module RAMP protein Cmr1 [Thiothrix lacustris]